MKAFIRISTSCFVMLFMVTTIVISHELASSLNTVVPLVKRDFSDCLNTDVVADDSSLIGGIIDIHRYDDSFDLQVNIDSGTPNTAYQFYLKCIGFLGIIDTDANGVGSNQFTFNAGLVGEYFAFDMSPDGAPSGNKYQSLTVNKIQENIIFYTTTGRGDAPTFSFPDNGHVETITVGATGYINKFWAGIGRWSQQTSYDIVFTVDGVVNTYSGLLLSDRSSQGYDPSDQKPTHNMAGCILNPPLDVEAGDEVTISIFGEGQIHLYDDGHCRMTLIGDGF